jgi:6-phosphofructokinase 1
VVLVSGIAQEREGILIPGQQDSLKLKVYLKEAAQRKSSIILGPRRRGELPSPKDQGRIPEFDIRTTILGHTTGGSPRHLTGSPQPAGHCRGEALVDDQKNIMVGLVNNDIVYIPLAKTIKLHKDVNRKLLELVDILI